nr:9193_t:CDS:2 [Entrophospora candida]
MRVVHFIIRISKSKLSKWLRFGAIEQNIKSTLKSTIDSLHDVCPLKVSREIISKSLHDILCKDKVFRERSEIHNRIFNWFEEKNSSEPSRPYAVFKKRVYSSAFFGSKVFTNNYNTDKNRESFLHLSGRFFPSVTMDKSFRLSGCMGMDISDVDLRGFCLGNSLYDRQTHGLDNYNMSSTGKTFIHAPVDLLRTMFGIKWHTVIIKELYAIKERLDNKIIKKWMEKTTLGVKNENQSQTLKRKYDDSNFCEMTKFVKGILKEVNETKEGSKQKIMKLVLREDEDLIQIWRSVKTTLVQKRAIPCI